METEVDVDNKNLSITPGMYANTLLQLKAANNVVTGPVEALVLNAQQQPTVYVLDGANRVHIRIVTTGLEGSKLAEITSGLSPGDRVVLGGQEKYQEGEEVAPVLATAPASETVQESGGMIDLKSGANGGGN
jgi:multidrug efflux pump subunit AcrA (membrane-fusion protein)